MFDNLSDRLSGIFKRLKGRGRLNESDVKEVMREIKLALLEADVNIKTVKDFIAKVTDRAVGAEVTASLTPAQQVIKIVNQELTNLMGGEDYTEGSGFGGRIRFSSKPPTIVMMVGLQGSGKTTHSAKLANHFRKQSKRPLLVACDVYRPAAIKQLQVLGAQLNIPVFSQGDGEKPENIAKAAIKHAKDHGNDIVFIDTAGRLHIDEEMMSELIRVKNATDPDEIILVVDAMTGQDAANVAQKFDEVLSIDGVVVAKLDSDARGGAALSVRHITGKPIKFMGTGEKMSDLEAFHPERMASRILGMGDMLTLIEQTEQLFDEKEAEKLEKKIRNSSLDLSDFLDQMQQVKKMGPLEKVLGMIPGIKPSDLQNATIDEKAISRTEAIIQSMTPHERSKPSVIAAARKRRIAAGAGVRVEDVNRLLKQFEQTKDMMKKFANGKMPFKMPR